MSAPTCEGCDHWVESNLDHRRGSGVCSSLLRGSCRDIYTASSDTCVYHTPRLTASERRAKADAAEREEALRISRKNLERLK